LGMPHDGADWVGMKPQDVGDSCGWGDYGVPVLVPVTAKADCPKRQILLILQAFLGCLCCECVGFWRPLRNTPPRSPSANIYGDRQPSAKSGTLMAPDAAFLTPACGDGNRAWVSASAQARAARFAPRGISPASARNSNAASRRYRAAFRPPKAASPPPRWWTDRRGAARGAACRNATGARGRE
jgi:hypothetical protein